MSGQVASTLGPIDHDSSQLDEPVVEQQPSVEQPQQEQPAAAVQDITPGKEEVDVEDPGSHDEGKEKDPLAGPGLETDSHEELALAKTGGKAGDGSDVKEEIASNSEPVGLPEAGRSKSGHVASTLGPIDHDSSQLDEPEQQPSVEQPQQEQPPAEVQDITPGKEEVDVEDPGSHDEGKEKDPFPDTGLETDFQEELTLAKTGGKAGDGPDVKEEIASNRELVGLPEAGEGQSFP